MIKTEHADISIKHSKLKENILTYTNIYKQNFQTVSVNLVQMADLIWPTEGEIIVIPYMLPLA